MMVAEEKSEVVYSFTLTTPRDKSWSMTNYPHLNASRACFPELARLIEQNGDELLTNVTSNKWKIA